jgi:hypothetical protein
MAGAETRREARHARRGEDRAAGAPPAPARRCAPGVRIPFAWVRARGSRAYISGHRPPAPDGSLAGPFGKVGADVTVEQAYAAARLTALSILGSLGRALGDLDRVTAWLRVFGMVSGAPGLRPQPAVINGFVSDLLLELYGPEVGQAVRSAVGMADLPFGISVEIAGEVEIAPR